MPLSNRDNKMIESEASQKILPLLNSKDLAGKWAEQDGTGRPTRGGSRQRKQRFQQMDDDSVDTAPGVILCGVRDPSNVGSIMRTCNCFGVSRLLHLHYAANEATNETYWTKPHVAATLQSCSVGTCVSYEYHGTPFQSISVSDYTLLSDRPVVVLEAISGAISIHDYKFPRCCDIMVGSEHKGVSEQVLRKLRKDIDAVVFVPMTGPHHSLNVSSALTIALYEYRRQWGGNVSDEE